MTYLGPDGRQYVVIAAGGHGTPIGPPIGDYLVAFAVPKVAPRARRMPTRTRAVAAQV